MSHLLQFSAPTPSSRELIKQQILLGQIRAAARLFRHQKNLRNILSQMVPLDPATSAGQNYVLASQGLGVEDDGSGMDSNGQQPSNLLQQILMLATQPSPLKAMFSLQEMLVCINIWK